MPLALLCDEHIDYDIIAGPVRQGIDAVSVQEIGLAATDDALILAEARQLGRVVYTGDDDYLRLSGSGITYLGISTIAH
jgi:predicted nuclease of predicted toxin-antitoxin system